MSALCGLNIRGLLQGEHPEIWAQSDPPKFIWASETFDRKLWPNGYRWCNGHNGEPIGIHHRSFEYCHRWPSTTPLPPKWWFHMPPTYANGHISATGDPIHFMFGSRVGFSGTADRTALFTIRTNPRWRPQPSWKNFKWRYLRNRSSDPLHVLF